MFINEEHSKILSIRFDLIDLKAFSMNTLFCKITVAVITIISYYKKHF